MLTDFVNRNRGWVRSVVQMGWAILAGWAPVQWLLDTLGWAVSSDNVEAAVFLVTFGLIRLVGGWMEGLRVVRDQPLLRHMIGILMGGETAPEYTGAPPAG